MSKFWVIFNFVTYLAIIVCIPFFGEHETKLVMVYMQAYMFLYAIYLVVNRIQFYLKKKKFENWLFLFPLLMVPLYYSCYYMVRDIYKFMDNVLFSFIYINDNQDVICSDVKVCELTIYGKDNFDKSDSLKPTENILVKSFAKKGSGAAGKIIVKKPLRREYLVHYSHEGNGECIILTSSSYTMTKFYYSKCDESITLGVP
jgi:hypothetical protein